MATGQRTQTSAWRDPWMWALAPAALPVVLRASGLPLGEPFADDFAFLRRALFDGALPLTDGGGSPLFWRPLSRQVYFGLFGRLMLAHPAWIAAIHVLVLVASAALVYRALRPRWPAAWCAAAASFPLLLEANRMLITWPSHFQDLGALLFAALALHEASRERLWTMALALLGSLLCKEVAAVATLLLPWVPTAPGRSRRARLQATGWAALVLAGWGALYWKLTAGHGQSVGYGAEAAAPFMVRAAWALWNSARSAFSLPIEGGAEIVVATTLAALLGVAGVLYTGRDARARMRAAWPTLLWGTLWWVAATLPLSGVYPLWSAQRAVLASVGLGVLLVGLLGTAHPLLLAPLVALRLVAFAMSPGGVGRVTEQPPPGIEGDFPHVERLQRLTHETRALLEKRVPAPHPGARFGQHHYPGMTGHAFAGDLALQVWYGDTTLAWTSFEEFRRNPEMDLVGFVEYRSRGVPELSFVETAAMRAQLAATQPMEAARWADALALLERAESLQQDTTAVVFRATTRSQRSVCLLMLGRAAEAEGDALDALEWWPENPYSRFTIAQLMIARKQYADAERMLAAQVQLYPEDATSRGLLSQLRAAGAAGAR